MQDAEVIIIGAGAAGLMAGRELSKAGKKVIILEARDRIGGRILPLPENEFGYPAQGGAEFVHGDAPVTKSLAKEAGITLILTEGDMWNSRNGELTVNEQPVANQGDLPKKLKALKKDIPIAEFLDRNFSGETYAELRESITRMVEGYDAADPWRISTFALRDEWLGNEAWLQYRIKEGYGPLLNYLKNENVHCGVDIWLDTQVKEIRLGAGPITLHCADGSIYEGGKVILTVPLPLIKDIHFVPAIPEKLAAAEKIGYGGAIKILLKFKSRWWMKTSGKDFGEMDFMISQEKFSVWWTQNPNPIPLLSGWLGGPKTEKYNNASTEDILEESIISLANIFNVTKEYVLGEVVHAQVFNWPADPMSRGSYSYTTPETAAAQEELSKPVDGRLFFAGEALYQGKDAATVEGALANGQEVARKILDIK